MRHSKVGSPWKVSTIQNLKVLSELRGVFFFKKTTHQIDADSQNMKFKVNVSWR